MLSSILRKLSSLLFCLLFANSVQAALTDIKFGQYQIADSQWNVSACLNTNTCQIYSKNPGTAYKIPWTNGKLSWGYQDYVKFSLSGNSSYPYTATQYYGNGTIKAVLGNGKIVNMGPDYFFFVGSDNNTGQLFSGSSGMNSTAGVSWTGTRNPTVAQADAYADANYSTTPLAAGETATTTPSSPPPPPPTPVYSSSITAAQASRRAANLPTTGMEANINITGNSNLVTVEQIGDAHYLELGIIGGSNTVNITQTTITGGQHYLETTVQGSNNNLDILQSSTAKTAFVTVNGNSNTADIIQRDTGQHYLQLDMIGDGHDATIIQEGSGNHAATIELTNGGGAWNFGLTQTGATSQTYSLPHGMSDGSTTSGICYVAAGCSLTVTQQ